MPVYFHKSNSCNNHGDSSKGSHQYEVEPTRVSGVCLTEGVRLCMAHRKASQSMRKRGTVSAEIRMKITMIRRVGYFTALDVTQKLPPPTLEPSERITEPVPAQGTPRAAQQKASSVPARSLP